VLAVIVTWSSGAADAGGVGMPSTTTAAATIVPTTRRDRDVIRVMQSPPFGNARPSGRDVHVPDVPSKGDIDG
jgi:hypothetical protein